MQQIEDVIDEVRLAVLERVLQRREIADAVLVLDHDLAVDQRAVSASSFATASATGLNLCGPVEPLAGEQLAPCRRRAAPACGSRRTSPRGPSCAPSGALVAQRRELRRDEVGQGARLARRAGFSRSTSAAASCARDFGLRFSASSALSPSRPCGLSSRPSCALRLLDLLHVLGDRLVRLPHRIARPSRCPRCVRPLTTERGFSSRMSGSFAVRARPRPRT